MVSTIRAITTLEGLQKIREPWNDLVHRRCENPYFLCGFVEQFFQSRVREGKKPLFLVYFVGTRIVGIAPFVVLSWRGLFRVASFITSSAFDPDFVVEEQYREDFLFKALDFLFDKVGCHFIDVSVPSGTESLEVLRKASESLGAYQVTRPIAGHSVIPVEGSWSEFEKGRGRNFRKFFRRIERRIGSVGTWKVGFGTKEDSEDKTCKEMLEIENSSWKQGFRTQMGLETDQTLLDLWAGATNSSLETGFRWEVAFLDIGGKRVAYSFWLEFKDKAFVCKTSFDDGYRKYYPGIFINNVAVRELFKNPVIKQIDFMTDLPFQYRWNPHIIPRFRLIVSKSPVPIVLAGTVGNQHLWSALNKARQRVGRVAFRFPAFT